MKRLPAELIKNIFSFLPSQEDPIDIHTFWHCAGFLFCSFFCLFGCQSFISVVGKLIFMHLEPNIVQRETTDGEVALCYYFTSYKLCALLPKNDLVASSLFDDHVATTVMILQ
jgi:hypothetical protein